MTRQRRRSEGLKVNASEEDLRSALRDGQPRAGLTEEAHDEALRIRRDELGSCRALETSAIPYAATWNGPSVAHKQVNPKCMRSSTSVKRHGRARLGKISNAERFHRAFLVQFCPHIHAEKWFSVLEDASETSCENVMTVRIKAFSIIFPTLGGVC